MRLTITDNIISDFLINPKFRIYRHLFLLFISFLFTLSLVLDAPESPMILFGAILHFVVFAGTIYLNVFYSTPRFLFKNKFLKYFIFLILIVCIEISCVLFIQLIIFSVDIPEGINYLALFFGICSTAFTFLLMYVGTTTVLLFKYWITYSQQISELESQTLDSELKLLKNQINPHFLLNMLNNANMLLKKDGDEASRVLFKLEDLLRYQLNDSSKEMVSLVSDIHFLNDFLNLEKIRRDKFECVISHYGDVDIVKVPPLLFIIFAENAIKHNPDNDNMSYVHISFEVQDKKLNFICENSKPEIEFKTNKVGGLGLKNVKRRLELLYPNRHTLEINNERLKYTVKLELTL